MQKTEIEILKDELLSERNARKIAESKLEQQSKELHLLIESEKRLSSIISNLKSGIVLEDENRKIVFANSKFCEIFKINTSPENLLGHDCSIAAEKSKALFEKPSSFISRINDLLKNEKQVFGDEMSMLDGTFLERDFIPVKIKSTLKGYLWVYNDITLIKQYKESLISEKQKYRRIIENMNLGLVEVNNNDQILMVNQNFCKISGYSEKELIGQIGSKIFPIEEHEKIIEKEKFQRLKGNSNSYEIKAKNNKGELKYWLISGAPNYNLKGEVIGSIGIHLDITELKKLEFQKEKILKELEKSNNELYEYAHVVSHDLKSPLRSINALVSWIKTDNEGKLDNNSLQNLQLIESTLETMENLISNILLYSSAGANTEDVNEVDLNKIIENLKRVLYIPSHISINVLKKLPIVKGDKTKFQQIFQNLISNAIKFNNKEEGVIEIDFTEKKSFYEFCVKDNGIGIQKKYHDKIFKIFHSLNKSEDSSGIGLSIVKKIVNLYEGDIWLKSIPNISTKFYFALKK